MAKNCMKLSFLFIAFAKKFNDLLGFWKPPEATELGGGIGEAIRNPKDAGNDVAGKIVAGGKQSNGSGLRWLANYFEEKMTLF